MKPILVLGLGNRLMMDDGIGVAVVEALAKEEPADPRVRCVVGETDFEFCLNVAAEAEFLVLVDAVVAGGRPGDVTVYRLEELSPMGPAVSMHQAHLVDMLLRDGRRGVLVGIEPCRIDFGWGLSGELERVFHIIVGRVKAACKHSAGSPPSACTPPSGLHLDRTRPDSWAAPEPGTRPWSAELLHPPYRARGRPAE